MNVQSALAPAGVHAEKIARLWDVFLYVSIAVWVLVMIALLIALFRRRRGHADPGGRASAPSTQHLLL